MNNRIHLHGISFILVQPWVKTIFNHHLNIPIIDTPEMILRPKVQNRYIPFDYSYDLDDGSFDYTHYGKSVFNPKVD